MVHNMIVRWIFIDETTSSKASPTTVTHVHSLAKVPTDAIPFFIKKMVGNELVYYGTSFKRDLAII